MATYTRLQPQSVQFIPKFGTVTLIDVSESYGCRKGRFGSLMNLRQVQNRYNKQHIILDLHIIHNLGRKHAKAMGLV